MDDCENLFDAVCLREVEVARQFLDEGADPDDCGGRSRTPLFTAVEGDLEMTRLLIEHGADVNAKVDYGYTVLMNAVSVTERDPEIVRLLLKSGADVNARTSDGYTPLHCAIDVDFEANAPECVRGVLTALIQAGADLEARQHWGWTPLVRAVMEGIAIEEVEVLLEHGANPFVAGFECFNFCPSGGTLLHAAAVEPDKLRLLLEAGLDPFATADNGQTALDIAEECLRHHENELAQSPTPDLEEPDVRIADTVDDLFAVSPDITRRVVENARESIRILSDSMQSPK